MAEMELPKHFLTDFHRQSWNYDNNSLCNAKTLRQSCGSLPFDEYINANAGWLAGHLHELDKLPEQHTHSHHAGDHFPIHAKKETEHSQRWLLWQKTGLSGSPSSYRLSSIFMNYSLFLSSTPRFLFCPDSFSVINYAIGYYHKVLLSGAHRMNTSPRPSST